MKSGGQGGQKYLRRSKANLKTVSKIDSMAVLEKPWGKWIELSKASLKSLKNKLNMSRLRELLMPLKVFLGFNHL